MRMLNFTYETPKEKINGRRENETVESSSKHDFKDSNLDVFNSEIKKLMAKYPDDNFDISIRIKEPKKSKK